MVLAALLLVAGSAAAQTPESTPVAVDTTTIPDDALRVCASGCDFASIEDALAAATPGATVVVDGGSWSGPLEITASVRLVGLNGATIDGHGEGTIVRISAPDVVLQGFTIQHSGSNFDKEDSAVYVEAERVQVLDNQLLDTLFGVNAATAHDGVIARNYILGKDVDMGVRGDGIKVWYSHRMQITGNEVERSRDLLVWYSNDVLVADNTVFDGRYGFHFMNSDNGVAERNSMVNNSVAIYLMYGRNFVIRDNLLQGSRGPSGQGLGLKEIDGVLVEGNIVYDNRIGIFIDNSPLSPNVYSHFRENLIAYNDQGFGVLPSSRNNVLSRNSMIDNLEQVAILGSGQMGDNAWSEEGVGNFWSDYAGYDADGDGIGDLPFRSEQLSEQVMDAWPNLQLFRFSVAEAAVDFGSRAVPMFRQEPKFTDEHPLISPVIPANAPRPADTANATMTSVWSLAMLLAAAGVVWWGVRGTRHREISRPTPARAGSPRTVSTDTTCTQVEGPAQ
jgi:nitrous oxidase accessory protein